MATAKKTTKAAEVTTAEVKVEAPKATVAKKATTKATAEKKTTTKKATTTKKETAKKETTITVQFQGNEVAVATVEEKVIAAFVADGHKASTIKTLNIYVKPEEYAAYYVINGEFTGRVDLFF